MQAANERLKAAKSVLIVGGGAVGVEVAGEIASVLPDKQVTLVHSRDKLLVDDRPRMSATAKQWLENNNVKVRLWLCRARPASCCVTNASVERYAIDPETMQSYSFTVKIIYLSKAQAS